MNDNRSKAKRLLVHYFYELAKAADVRWDLDSVNEVEAIEMIQEVATEWMG